MNQKGRIYSQSENLEEVFDDLCFEYRKEKEILLVKKGKGHYRCMVNDEKMYEQIMMAVSPYITREMLTMLWHTYDTNLNEAMNRSVSAFAPKDRTFCRSMSLTTRISIAAGVQLVGHYKYWEMMLERQGIKMSSALGRARCAGSGT